MTGIIANDNDNENLETDSDSDNENGGDTFRKSLQEFREKFGPLLHIFTQVILLPLTLSFTHQRQRKILKQQKLSQLRPQD